LWFIFWFFFVSSPVSFAPCKTGTFSMTRSNSWGPCYRPRSFLGAKCAPQLAPRGSLGSYHRGGEILSSPHRRVCSPLGDKFAPRGQLLPWGPNFTSWGWTRVEKNWPLLQAQPLSNLEQKIL
jgi:hypothetical protein